MPLVIKQPWDIPNLDLNQYKYKFLAEGDSWFSIGEFPPWGTSSLLFEMNHGFTDENLVINCARQGDTLSHMHEMWYDNNFTLMLDAPNQNYYWDALLLSVGGNDLIDACLVNPQVAYPEKRLLLRTDEVPLGSAAAAYISEAGWQAFANYLRINFADLVQRRNNGLNRNAAIFLHTYSRTTVRKARAGNALFHVGPWLHKAVTLYGLPEPVWQPLVDILFQRLASLLLSLGNPAQRIFVFDSQNSSVGVVPALPGTAGVSNDFENEIHLTPTGYRKIGNVFATFINTHI
jgi:lysophospholipase L1-like esterase